ncbi:MAG: hypothetical protein ACK4YP_16045 [Myxococcota bacterium]
MLSLLTLLAAVSSVHAQDATYGDLLTQAKGALLAGDYRGARDILTTAEQVAPTEDTLLSTKDLARLYFYRGVLFWRASPESAALDAWRQTLTIDPTFQPEPDLLGDPTERDVFLALGDEVKARGEIGLDLPEDPGMAKIYVDGRPVESGDAVIAGSHFIQIKCEDGELAGAWYAYGTPPSDYLTICEGGLYKAPRTSSSSSKSSSKSSAKTEKSEKPEREARSSSRDEKSGDKKSGGGDAGKNIAGISLLGLGVGGGVVTTLFYDQATQAAEAYARKDAAADENPDLEESADAYYEDVVKPRYLRTYAAGAGSAVLLAGGVTLIILGVEGPMVTPVPGGGVFTWSGRF